jgi:hypothetical protein
VTRYEILVDGAIGPAGDRVLDGFEVRWAADGRSCLVGDVVDQAALHGALHRLQDLRLDIIDLHRMDDA